MVKCYLSFFSLYRIILLAKLIDNTTFSSIVTPVQDMHRVYSTISRMKESVVPLLDRYIPWFRRILLYQGMSWEPTVPTMSQANEKLKSGASQLWLGPSFMDLISPVSHA